MCTPYGNVIDAMTKSAQEKRKSKNRNEINEERKIEKRNSSD